MKSYWFSISHSGCLFLLVMHCFYYFWILRPCKSNRRCAFELFFWLGIESNTLLAHRSHFCHNGRPVVMPYNSQLCFVKSSLGPIQRSNKILGPMHSYSNYWNNYPRQSRVEKQGKSEGKSTLCWELSLMLWVKFQGNWKKYGTLEPDLESNPDLNLISFVRLIKSFQISSVSSSAKWG